MHKSNNVVTRQCINVTIVNKYLIPKKTYTNMLKFIQIMKEIKKMQVNKKKKMQVTQKSKQKLSLEIN